MIPAQRTQEIFTPISRRRINRLSHPCSQRALPVSQNYPLPLGNAFKTSLIKMWVLKSVHCCPQGLFLVFEGWNHSPLKGQDCGFVSRYPLSRKFNRLKNFSWQPCRVKSIHFHSVRRRIVRLAITEKCLIKSHNLRDRDTIQTNTACYSLKTESLC